MRKLTLSLFDTCSHGVLMLLIGRKAWRQVADNIALTSRWPIREPGVIN